ncbi:MAG: hypothetical protein ABIS36_03920 [Chryseolinea sp.]
MAFQKSFLKLEGTVDGLSIYQSNDRYIVRKKSGVSGDRIKNDPAYVRARENMLEFGRSGKAAKLIRVAFRLQIADIADNGFTPRLVQTLMRIIKSDTVNERGQRDLLGGDTSELLNLEFNAGKSLTQIMHASFISSIDRSTGSQTVEVPAFIPSEKLSKPDGATHFRLFATAAELDFDADKHVSATMTSGDLVIGSKEETAKLVCRLPEASKKMLLLAFGIQFGR